MEWIGQNGNTNLIISGPARVGKTYLACLIKKQDHNMFVLPFEGLIYPYLSYVWTKKAKKEIIQKFLKHKRIDYEKQRLMSFYDMGIDLPVPTNESTNTNKDKLILNIFDYCSRGKPWVVCDLHSEFVAEKIFSYRKDVRFIWVYRRPVESICARLFWRTYPERRPGFVYFTILWVLSYVQYKYLKEKYPDRIEKVNFYDIWDKEELPYYSFHKGKFYLQNKKWEALLSKQEVMLLQEIEERIGEKKGTDFHLDNIAKIKFLFISFLKRIYCNLPFSNLFFVQLLFAPIKMKYKLVKKLIMYNY